MSSSNAAYTLELRVDRAPVGTPLGAFSSRAKGLTTMRQLVKNWRQHGVHPRGLPHPANSLHHVEETSWGPRCTACVRHGNGGDGKAIGGLWFTLKHRGAEVGELRLVRTPTAEGG
jgi:hypothetical protein